MSDHEQSIDNVTTGPAFMHLRFLLPLALPLVLLSGCSAGPSSPVTLNKSLRPLNISGNWQFSATSTTNKVAVISATLTSTQGAVSGIAHIISSCYQAVDVIPLVGTIDNSGNVTVTSAVAEGQTLSFTGIVSADGLSFSAGSYFVHGGCANGDKGTLTGLAYQALTGTYTGPVKSESGTTVQVTATLSQSATPNALGGYGESGSALFTGSPCFNAATIDNSSTAVLGGALVLDLVLDPQTRVNISGTFDPLANSLQMSYSVVGGMCGGDAGSGLLTRQ